jgi:hypothetical protein
MERACEVQMAMSGRNEGVKQENSTLIKQNYGNVEMCDDRGLKGGRTKPRDEIRGEWVDAE